MYRFGIQKYFLRTAVLYSITVGMLLAHLFSVKYTYSSLSLGRALKFIKQQY